MDSKVPQYQRAVTPTIIDSNASPNLVRGKLLSYNSNVIRTGRAGSVSDKLFGSMNSIPSPSLSVGASLSPRSSVGGVETNVQGRSSSGKSTGASSGKYTSEGIACGSGTDSLATAFSVLPRYDLVPISSELPSDGIIFARTKTLPEMLVVFRTTEERLRNPERLNLDRRQLEICPLLEQEQRLRLLNFQNNNIHAIQNLENLPNLIFLDLYNNKISSLDGPLSTVKGLRVLMAGKNKISAISNLRPLRKLDVLDLHSNEIRLIEGLDGLSDLRVLNLAGNRINVVNNLSSLVSLTELNLRRNNIDSVTGLNQLPALQRVFLSHNNISRLDDVRCLFDVSYLIELSLDGNPISDSDQPLMYRAHLVVGMPGLRHLDLKRVTEEERVSAVSLLNSSSAGSGSLGGEGAGSTDAAVAAARRRKETSSDLPHASQQLILSDYDGNSVDNNKINGNGGQRTGYSSDEGEGSMGEDVASSNRDDRSRVAEEHLRRGSEQQLVGPPAAAAAAARGMQSPGHSSGSSLPRTFSMERKGLQKYVGTPSEALAGTSSAGIAHLNGLQQPPGGGQASPTAAAAKASPVGLAAQARSGQLSYTSSLFDLEVIGPDEKALIAVGDGWEWTANKRLLLNVVEASLYHMKRQTVMSKFGSSQVAALPAMKCLRFVSNDFSSLKSVEFIPAMFGRQLEQLTVRSCPLSSSCSPQTLRSYFVASMPKLRHFNDEEVTAADREQAELLFGPLLRAQRAASLEQQRNPVTVAAVASLSTAPGSLNGSSTSRHHHSHQKGLQHSLLRALQQQAQQSTKPSLFAPLGAPVEIAGVRSTPFMAPAHLCVGSTSAEAMRQSANSAADPGAGSSGLSQKALQRRRQYAAFCASFDEAFDKIVLEAVLEMKIM